MTVLKFSNFYSATDIYVRVQHDVSNYDTSINRTPFAAHMPRLYTRNQDTSLIRTPH